MMRVIISVATPTGRLGELNRGPVPTANRQRQDFEHGGGAGAPDVRVPLG